MRAFSRQIGRLLAIGAAVLVGPFAHGAIDPDTLADSDFPLPAFKFPDKRAPDYYPPPARRQGITGAIIIAFSLAPSGEITRPVVVFADHSLLADRAMEMLQTLQFRPPPGWDGQRQVLHRYRISFQFHIGNCDKREAPAPIQTKVGDTALVICASPILRGSAN